MIRTNALSTTSHSQNQILRPPLQDRKLRINSRRNSKWLKNRKEGTAQTKKRLAKLSSWFEEPKE